MALTNITKDFVVKSGLIVGTTATIKGNATLQAGLAVTGISTLTSAVYASDTLHVTHDTTLQQGLRVSGISTLTGATFLGDGLTVSNDAVLQSGLAVTGISTLTSAVYAGSTLNVAGQFTVATNKLTVTTDGNITAAGDAVIDGNALVSGEFTATLATTLGSTLDVAGVTTLTDATAASFGSQTGSLKLTGGEYIGKNLVVAATDANTGTLTSNALYVNGGVGIAGSLAVSQDAVFKGNVFFQGETTYSLSTNTVYTDNLLELHVNGSVDTPWGFDDGKDIGFRFHYYDAADKNGAIVLANDTKYFEFYKDGTENGGVFTSDVYATLKAGTLHLVDTTDASNTSSGALTVEGGVGIGGTVYVGGDVHATTFVGALTGTATQANNLNGGETGGIPIQSASGVTTFIAPGSADNQVLTWQSGSSTATWASASGTTVGTATNADNVQVSATDGTTTYYLTMATDNTGSHYSLEANTGVSYNSSTDTLTVNSASLQGSGGGTVTLSDTNNEGTQLYSTNYAQLNYDNTNYVWVQSDGAHISAGGGALHLDASGNLGYTGGTFTTSALSVNNAYTLPTDSGTNGYFLKTDAAGIASWADVAFSLNADSGSGSVDISSGGSLSINGGTDITVSVSGSTYTITNNYSYTPNDTLDSVTTRGASTTNAITVGGLTDTALGTTGGIVYNNGGGTLADSSNLTFNGTSLTIGGSGGDITMSGGNITGVTDVTASGTVQGGHLKDTSLNINGGLVYTDSTGQLQDSNVLTYDGTSLTVNTVSVNGSSGQVDATNLVLSSSTAGAVSGPTKSGALVVENGGAYIDNNVIVNGVGAASSGTPALSVDNGGAYLDNDLLVNSSAPTLGAASGGAVQVNGGVGIAKDLYVGTTATIHGNLFVDGTLYIKGQSLTGIDQITGSTGTFVDIVSTGTISANAITASSIKVSGADVITTDNIGSYANTTHITAGAAIGVASSTSGSTTTYTISNLGVRSLNNTTGTITIAGGTNISVDSTSTPGTITINNDYVAADTLQDVTTRGATTSDAIEITNATASDTRGTGNGALKVTGGIHSGNNIVAGGMLVGGDGTEATSGTVAGLYIRNNVQAAGTFTGIGGSSAVQIDSWDTTLYTSAKYTVQIVDGNNVYVSELMIMQINGNAYISEYGIVSNDGELGEYSITQSSTNLVLNFTPTSATAMTIQVVRQSILTADEANYC